MRVCVRMGVCVYVCVRARKSERMVDEMCESGEEEVRKRLGSGLLVRVLE